MASLGEAIHLRSWTAPFSYGPIMGHPPMINEWPPLRIGNQLKVLASPFQLHSTGWTLEEKVGSLHQSKTTQVLVENVCTHWLPGICMALTQYIFVIVLRWILCNRILENVNF